MYDSFNSRQHPRFSLAATEPRCARLPVQPLLESTQMRDMPNLDLVRSMAVISVVVEHSLLAFHIMRVGPFETQWFGVLGVMVFFVLTCLVLMWSLERKPHTLDFYVRRWFRIYPLAIAAMLIAVTLHVPIGGSPNTMFAYHPQSLFAVLLQMTLFPGLYIPIESVMWSLPYEVGMYMLLPMIFFFIRQNFSLWPMLLLWIVDLFLCRAVPASGHNFAVAIGYFLPGIMAYVAYGRWKPKLPGWLLPVFLCALWAMFWYNFNFHRCWVFCLLVGLGLPLFRQMEAGWAIAVSRVIARYSYGIYLTHPFALAAGLYLFREHSIATQLAVALPCLVAFPVAAYHWIELPMIRAGSRVANRVEQKYEQHEVVAFRQVRTAN